MLPINIGNLYLLCHSAVFFCNAKPPSCRLCLANGTVVYLHTYFRERKEFFLRVLSLKMYISYNTNVRKLCPISNKSIKFIKKLQKFVTVHSVLSNTKILHF